MKIEHFSISVTKMELAAYFENKLKAEDDTVNAGIIIVMLMIFIGIPAVVLYVIKDVCSIDGPGWSLVQAVVGETLMIIVLLICYFSGVCSNKRLYKMLKKSKNLEDVVNYIVQKGLADEYIMVSYILLFHRFLYARELSKYLYIYYETEKGQSVYKITGYHKAYPEDAEDLQLVVSNNNIYVTETGTDSVCQI